MKLGEPENQHSWEATGNYGKMWNNVLKITKLITKHGNMIIRCPRRFDKDSKVFEQEIKLNMSIMCMCHNVCMLCML